MEIRQNDQ
jgi:hypothetical protein